MRILPISKRKPRPSDACARGVFWRRAGRGGLSSKRRLI